MNLLVDRLTECVPSEGFFGVVSSGIGAKGYEPLKRTRMTGHLVWLER